MRLFATHAWLDGKARQNVRLVEEAGRWVEVAVGAAPQPTDIVLDALVLPGFANVHSHAFHRGLRGRTHAKGNFWTWRERMYELASKLDPDSYFELARATYAEMVAAGYTSVGEFHYLHHREGGKAYPEVNAMGLALIAAAREAGIRLTLLDTCYLQGGLHGGTHLPLDEVQLRFSDGSVEAWRARVSQLADHVDDEVIGSAAHSVRALSTEELREFANTAPAIGPITHLHLSEQPAENAEVEATYGVSPTWLAGDCGLLGPTTVAVHATHLSPDDIALLIDTGTAVCICPTTERDLADGIGPASQLLDRGASVSIGSDQHAVIDPFDELRCLEGHERLESLQRGVFSPATLAKVATAHHQLGRGDCGELAVGMRADAVVVRLDSVRTAGCDPNQIWFAASAADVSDVIVGGEFIVRDGHHRLGDLGEMMTKALAAL